MLTIFANIKSIKTTLYIQELKELKAQAFFISVY